MWVRCGCGVGAVWVRWVGRVQWVRNASGGWRGCGVGAVRCARHGLLARGAEGVVRRLGGLEEDLVRVS